MAILYKFYYNKVWRIEDKYKYTIWKNSYTSIVKKIKSLKSKSKCVAVFVAH